MSDLLVWTFDGIPFYPTGVQERPEGKRSGRYETFNLVGTGTSIFNTFGFTEYTLDISVLVLNDTHATNLKAKLLTQGALIGPGTNQPNAFFAEIELLRKREHYHEGKVVFKWGTNN